MTLRNDLKKQPTYLIIPQGLLLSEINHSLSVKAFMVLASQENKTFDLNKVLPQILAEDRKFKAGGEQGLTEAEFLQKLRTIFDLTVATDDAIRQAWNAMLGDLSTLKATLDGLIKTHADKKIVLLSGTNPIHRQAIQNTLSAEEKAADTHNPLALHGLPLYVSYLQTATDFTVRCQDTNLLEELLTDAKIEPANALLVVSLTSQSPVPPLKASQEASEKKREEWAKAKGLQVVDYDRKNEASVAAVISRHCKTLAPAAPAPGLFHRNRRMAISLTDIDAQAIHNSFSPKSPSSR